MSHTIPMVPPAPDQSRGAFPSRLTNNIDKSFLSGRGLSLAPRRRGGCASPHAHGRPYRKTFSDVALLSMLPSE